MLYASYLDRDKQHYSYYVDDLRKKFTIRIEIKNTESPTTFESHTGLYGRILSYLEARLTTQEWAIQEFTGYNGLHYVWFTNKEDALAALLQFGGKII